MTGQKDSPTPIRKLAHKQIDGCRVLSEPSISYSDGSEKRLLEVMRGADDLSSLSDELESAAQTWPELYHLSKSRSNVLRPFRLHPRMRVLEIGGGCGAVTRYLGEVCELVDMVEPVFDRARVARARTRDLGNVEVFVGQALDAPPEQAYDLVVVVGVLEYVGPDPDAALQFLRRLSATLRRGGHILCAIENKLGVKYLAGAPEDHTSRVFDSIEGYPRGGPARTFSRSELTDLFGQAGLHPAFHHAFPDYKIARSLFADDLLLGGAEETDLALHVPSFPSPDRSASRPHLADERRLWKSLVEDGLGAHFSNSFVIAAQAGAGDGLWPPDLLGVFYTPGRRARFFTESRILRSEKGLTIERRVLGDSAPAEAGPLKHRVTSWRYVPGRNFIDVLIQCESDEEVAAILQRWVAMVSETTTAASAGSLDLGPNNLLVTGQGELVAIDQEWWHEDAGPAELIERGILWLAVHIAYLAPPDRWGVNTIGDLARELGRYVGLDGEGEWLQRAVRFEAALQANIHDCDPEQPEWEATVARHERQMAELLACKLSDTPLGDREHELRARAEARLNEVGAALAEKDGHIAGFQAMVAEKDGHIANLQEMVSGRDQELSQRDHSIHQLQAELNAIRRSLPYRMLRLFKRLVGWAKP